MAEAWHGRFCWYELMTTDPKAAEGFYGKVVGWGTQPFPGEGMPYTTWTKGEQAVGGLMELPRGGEGRRGPAQLDALRRRRERRRHGEAGGGRWGARWRSAPTDIPSIGRFAVLSDPAGAHFAILQPSDPGAGRPDAPPAPLDISWRELATTDREGAMAFYAALFGWEKQNANDMGEPVGVYQEFGRTGMPLGGIYEKPTDMPFPPHWLTLREGGGHRGVGRGGEGGRRAGAQRADGDPGGRPDRAVPRPPGRRLRAAPGEGVGRRRAGQGGSRTSSGRGRTRRTRTTETTAAAAKSPNVTSRGTCASRSAPKPQSAKPPQLMLTRFMMP